MKILLANHMLGGLSGTETWIQTMQEELERLGHQVTLYSSGQKLENADEIELAIINHNTCLKELSYLKCKKIFTCHGILPKLEQPIEGADIYVSISEEVKEHLKNKGFGSIVIRNGINCEKFKKINEPNEKIKNVLYSSNKMKFLPKIIERLFKKININIFIKGKARKIIEKACDELELKLEIIGKGNSVKDVVSVINRSDLVIGLGRTAYEAMACERNVIIYGYNDGDGFCTPNNLLEYRKNNCSGRKYKINFSIDDLKKEILKYNKNIGKDLREYILEHNNIKKTVQEYLQLK